MSYSSLSYNMELMAINTSMRGEKLKVKLQHQLIKGELSVWWLVYRCPNIPWYASNSEWCFCLWSLIKLQSLKTDMIFLQIKHSTVLFVPRKSTHLPFFFFFWWAVFLQPWLILFLRFYLLSRCKEVGWTISIGNHSVWWYGVERGCSTSYSRLHAAHWAVDWICLD